jgi:hypothetical protein
VGISPIFNVAYMYAYREDEARGEENQKEVQWVKQMPVAENPQMEKIIDQRVGKKTQRKTHLEYLVKWKGHLIEDANWESEEISKNMDRRCKSSWKGVHEFFSQKSMMQEHRKQVQVEDN